jgi:hypothetical protein
MVSKHAKATAQKEVQIRIPLRLIEEDTKSQWIDGAL